MIEIRYGDYSQQANLAGRSVAEVHQHYKEEWDIPDRAKAILNSKEVKKAMEPKLGLRDGDRLSFEIKKRSRLPILVGALALALAVSSGVFAYTYTTATAIITATATSDYAQVEVENGSITFPTNVLGHYRGDVPTGNLFKITPHAQYTGYLKVEVYLVNVDELTLAYKHLNIKMKLIDSDTPAGNICGSSACISGHEFQALTLDNGTVVFPVDPASWTSPFYVHLDGGSYRTHGRSPLDWGSGYEVSPQIYCDVHQM